MVLDKHHTTLDSKEEVELKENVHDVEYGEGATIHVVDDKADGYVNPDVVITPEENKRLRHKIHKRILPLLCLAYLLQALDKGTLGTASIMGWQQDVGAKGQDYALTATFLWIGLVGRLGKLTVVSLSVNPSPTKPFDACHWQSSLQEVSSSGRRCSWVWVSRSTLLQSSWSASSSACSNRWSVLVFCPVSRWFVILTSLVTVQWYLTSEQPLVQALWQCMLGLQSAISGLLGVSALPLQSNPSSDSTTSPTPRVSKAGNG